MRLLDKKGVYVSNNTALECARSARFRVGSAHSLGGKERMEDFVLIKRRFRNKDDEDLFAVMDGHSGTEAGDYVCQHFDKCFEENLKAFEAFSDAELKLAYDKTKPEVDLGACSHDVHIDTVVLALHTTFQSMRNQLFEKKIESGTTVLVAFFSQEHFFVANVGDTRAILGTSAGRSVRLSFDHKPHEPKERERIEKSGGEVVMGSVARIGGMLAVSRALGDFDLEHQGLSWRPYIKVLDTKEALDNGGEFIVMASDGIWDVITEQEAVDVVRNVTNDAGHAPAPPVHRPGERRGSLLQTCATETQVCMRLVELATRKDVFDNISVVLIRFTDAVSEESLRQDTDDSEGMMFEFCEEGTPARRAASEPLAPSPSPPPSATRSTPAHSPPPSSGGKYIPPALRRQMAEEAAAAAAAASAGQAGLCGSIPRTMSSPLAMGISIESAARSQRASSLAAVENAY
eukprot:tig00000093_g3451.t1